MSKANDFYPGTNERVCLVTGDKEAVTEVMCFLTEKVKEKPDPNSKPAIDFDSKVTAERDKQIKVQRDINKCTTKPMPTLGDSSQLHGGHDHREGRELHQAPEGDQWLLHPALPEGQGQHAAGESRHHYR